MATRTIRGITIEFGADTSKLTKAFSSVQHESKKVKDNLSDMNKLLRFDSKNVEVLKQKQGELAKQIETTSNKLKILNDMQKDLKSKGLDENSDEYKALRREIIDTEGALKNFQNQQKKLDEQLFLSNSKLNKQGEKFQEIGKKMQGTGDKIIGVGKKLTTGITLPLVGAGGIATKFASDYESAFAGVRKTTDATEKEYKALSDGIIDMSKKLPASASAIAEVAEAAGQLGIKKENLLSFSKVMIDLGESTNLTSTEAAEQLAKFANIVGMSQKDFDKLGSVVVDLGNNFATTEKDIVAMGMRLAGAGKQVGLTEAEIMGFSTALSSVGIEAEMGGSAFSKLMINMGVAAEVGDRANKVLDSTGMSLRDLEMLASHDVIAFGEMAYSMGMTKEELKKFIKAGKTLEGFSKVTGMTGEQFKKAFEKDAVGAIQMFLKGLKETDSKGGSAIAVLDEMGIKEVRLRDTILRATGATELFNDAVGTGTKAWGENTALTKEAGQRYETFASKVEILKNKGKALAIEFGEKMLPHLEKIMEKAGEWIEKFGNMDSSTQELIIKLGAFAALGGPVTTAFGTIIKGAGLGIEKIGSFGVNLAKLNAKIAGAGGIKASMGLAGAKIVSFGKAAAAVATGPVGLTIGAIAGLSFGAYKLHQHLSKEAIPEVDLFGDSVSESTKKAVGGFLELNEKATAELNSMMFNGDKVTKENSGKIISNFASMREKIVTELRTQKDEAKGVLDEMFENSLQFNISEREEMMKTVTEGYDNKIKTTEENEKRIQEILNAAKEEKRALTEEEKKQINGIQMVMRDDGIRILSESEAEQKVIMQRLADNQGAISARGAAEVVKQSAKQRDETIKNANTQYDEAIKLAEQTRLQGGAKAEETANKIINEAKRQRDEAVGKAKDMHSEVVGAAKKQAGDHVKEVDWETGQVKSKWQVLKEDIGEKAQGIARDVGKWWGETKRKTSEFWGNIKDIASNNINDAKTKISNTAGNIKKSVSEWWSKTKNDTSTKWGNIKSTMSEKFSSAKTSVTGLAGNIWTAITDKWDSLKRNTSRKWEQIKEAIMSPIRSAKKWLDGKIQAIKNAFNFEWKLPKFKLPKVSIGMAKSKRFGIPYPKFNVDWNRDGGIFRKPTVLPDAYGGVQGVGEPSTGGEAIMHLNKLPQLMAEAWEKTKTRQNVTVINYITLDGKVIAREVTDTVDQNLSIKSRRLEGAYGL